MFKKLLIFFILPITLVGQNTIGLPDVINYYKSDYRAGIQNWDIRQDKNGIIYIANNEGLLSYDGKYWRLYPLPNKTIVRSVEIGKDGKIYAGGQDELGYFSPGDNGKLQFRSLTPLIPEKERSFGDVWDISCLNQDIFVHTFKKIFKLSGEVVTVYDAPDIWSYMGITGGRLYAQDHDKGLFYYDNNNWSPLPEACKLPPNTEITAILPMGADSMLITTLKNGLFWLQQGTVSQVKSINAGLFEKARIYGATVIQPGWFALATTYEGVLVVDAHGSIIQSFAKKEGLQNNNVLSIFPDRQSNLWLGLDNGVDFITYNSAIKHIYPNGESASGYTAIIHDNELYTGTSVGLFHIPLEPTPDLSFSKGTFSAVANTTGQTWGLTSINDQLLLGHHEGAFLVKGNSAQKIISGAGYWNFVPSSNIFPAPRVIAGNYNGLSFFDYQDNTYKPAGNIPGFIESSRFVAIDRDGIIWVSHPYHGVYKLSPNGSNSYTIQQYTNQNGLPSSLNNHVYKLRSEVVVATEKGIYTYNAGLNQFEPSNYFRKIFGQLSLRYLKEDTQGNIWFIHEKNLGVVDMSGREPVIIYLPELNNKMLSGFESIYPVNENNIFIGGEKGFFHINFEKYKKNVPELVAHIRFVSIVDNKDSLLFGGYFGNVNDRQQQDIKKVPGISYTFKTIHFEFAAPVFGYQSSLEYSYRLKGFDSTWHEWSSRTEKEYTNLPAGNYTFEVKVRNNLGNESPITGYSFRVIPPWYKSNWAYLLYFLIAFACFFALYRWQHFQFLKRKKLYEEEQKKRLYILELERNKMENELISLSNEKLEADISFKNSELASSAMHLVKKTELITKLKNELSQLMKKLNNEQANAELKKVIKELNEDEHIDKDWEKFTVHFDKVHSDFIVKLKEKHPNITGNEVKLSAYLRMNLSTKEIAQLMNISVRGVEISRYRLRKKLGLATEVSLFDYLMSIEK